MNLLKKEDLGIGNTIQGIASINNLINTKI